MSLKIFCMVSLAIALILELSGCASGPVPRWDGKFWAGDSASAGVTRAQASDAREGHILASDPHFDSFVCTTYEDMRKLLAQYLYSCREWKEGTESMNALQAQEVFKLLLEKP